MRAKLMLVLPVLTFSSMCNFATPIGTAAFVWERLVSDSGISYQLYVASSLNGGIVYGGTFFFSKNGYAKPIDGGIWVRVTDNAGKELGFMKMTGDNYSGIDALAGLENGIIIVVINRKIGPSIIKTIDIKKNKVVFEKELERGISISKILGCGGGGTFLIGHKLLQSYILRIDINGNATKQVLDKLTGNYFVDGVCLHDRMILVKNKGERSQFFVTNSMVTTSIYDFDGNVVKEMQFPGRGGSVAILKTGEMAIVYDESMTAAQHIKAIGFSESMDVIWKTNVHDSNIGFESFNVSSYNNRFIVGGSVYTRQFVAVINAGGVLVNSFVFDKVRPGTGYKVLCKENIGCFSMSTQINQSEENIWANEGRIALFVHNIK